MLLLFTVAMGWTTGQVIGDPATQVGEMVEAGLVQLPGIMAIAAMGLVTGLLPRWSGPQS